jgi:GNAT superfamily N-acetyltransferase
MLMHASHEPTLESVKSQPYLARYAAGWGRAGDSGFVILASGLPGGAAWLRLWPDVDKGFGYVDDATPELAMAVLPQYQGKGLGTQILSRVLTSAKGLHPALSLNVRADNPVVRLYQRVGFVKVAGSEIVNRTGGVSFNMINRLES